MDLQGLEGLGLIRGLCISGLRLDLGRSVSTRRTFAGRLRVHVQSGSFET